MSDIKIFSKEGGTIGIPKIMVAADTLELLMPTLNPNVSQFAAGVKTPEETEEIRGVMVRKGEWIEKPKTREELMLIGVEIDGVMCSLTAEDMWGLKSVKDDVIAGMDVPYYFANGNVYVLTQANVAAFEAAWKPARASFFPIPT